MSALSPAAENSLAPNAVGSATIEQKALGKWPTACDKKIIICLLDLSHHIYRRSRSARAHRLVEIIGLFLVQTLFP